ncbi:MAG TPA: flippase-like domain-containing protein [Kofleriaceae bacterium]|nr:flippase-like domain-containing protein [Kofleriaceae bacterium]
MKRLVLFLALFIVLAGAGIVWSVRRSGVSPRDLGQLWSLPAGSLVLLALLCVGLYATDMIRYRLFARAIGESVDWRGALDTSVANFFFSWITPGAALGAPAAIVMLGRRGVTWEGATLIAFGKSVTGTVVLVALAFIAMACGYGPTLDGRVFAVFMGGIAVVSPLLLIPLVGVFWPERLLRGIARLERRFTGPIMTKVSGVLRRTVERLSKLRAGGAAMPATLLASHVLYLAVLVGIAVVLAVGFGATSVASAIGISTVYAAFSYVAPTPGGAGLSEAAATVFYGSILGAREAVLVVLLFRALTFYLGIAIGLLYLPLVGGTRQILAAKKTA